MTPEMYRQAGALFEQLRLLAEDEVAAALDTACAGNAELRAHVTRLLAADRQVGGAGFLERRALEDAANLVARETPPPAAGTVIGHYRLGARIGAGGMGIVYQGQDVHLDRRVAIKILPLTSAADSEERILRFQREARAASILNHPHIVSIYDADSAQGYHYIAMEFVEGQTLRKVVASPASLPDSQTILDWIGQIASALSAAHQAGIVHRDIKPENVMIRPDGFVKVLDFGLAKLREPTQDAGTCPPDTLTRPGNLPGTIRYLAPEQVRGDPAGPGSDLFSLGVVAYELATGMRPYDGPTDGAVFEAILNRTPPRPSALRPSLGSELDALIMRALEKDPELRFQTAGDMRSSCRRISRDYIARTVEKERESGAALSSAPSVMPAPERRSRRWLLWTGGLLACAVAAAFYWMTRAAPPLRVTRIVKITNDTPAVQRFVTDGTRIYYAAGNLGADIQVFQVGLNGGDAVPMARLTGMLPLDISPGRSQILVGQILKGAINQGSSGGPYPIWAVDTLGNAPRRLGDLTANDARWSPKGDEILFINSTELRIAKNDGSQARLVTDMKGGMEDPVWSPDESSLRFTLDTRNTMELWQVRPDGTHLQQLFPEWTGYTNSGGSWTPDGKYFFFSAEKGDNRDLWAVRRSRRLFESEAASLVRLTTGPIKVDKPTAAADGHRILLNGTLEAGELVRYDPKPDKWTPYLGGLAGMELDFSRDGKWITYVHFPDSSVWRSAPDASDRVQLTEPIYALNPHWSPDGRLIAFSGHRPEQQSCVYIVPASGGAVRQFTHGEGGSIDGDVSWSPDGALLVGGASSGDASLDPRQRLALETIDVGSGKKSKLPGSEGLWSARWSPDGRYIAALGFPNRLWLYDLATHAATKLTTIGAGWLSWSRDSQYVYFEDFSFSEWCRVRIRDRRVERVASLTGIKMPAESLGWCGLDPDGRLISLRNTGGTAIYALDWEAP
jgi:serine/threonine protein kinase/Tol biopolymer transport system component